MKQKQEKDVKIKVIERKLYLNQNDKANLNYPLSNPTVTITTTVTLQSGM